MTSLPLSRCAQADADAPVGGVGARVPAAVAAQVCTTIAAGRLRDPSTPGSSLPLQYTDFAPPDAGPDVPHRYPVASTSKHPTTPASTHIPLQVERYWFGGDPGRAGFEPDVRRWYFGGEQADKEIKQLFGAHLELILQSPGDPAWEVR